jgi:hypothetical protein
LHRTILRINRLAPGRLKESYRDHSAIAQGIFNRDLELAVQSVLGHLQFAKQFLLSG